MFENLNKTNVYAYLAGIFFACMIASNILATRTLEIGFIALPCSILTFPILFIVNDILSEIYGYKLTRDAPAFAALLSTTPRLFVAGLVSYMLGNLLNSRVLVKLKERYHNLLFVRVVGSTIIGETVDSVIFISLSFYGVLPNELIMTMICCQIVFKVLYELIFYPVTRKVILKIRSLDEGSLFSQN